MSLLSEVREDLGTVSVQPLEINQTTRRWVASGESFEASILDLSGREVVAMGKAVDTEMARLFADLDSDGEIPVDIKKRVRAEGKDWQIISARRVPDPESAGVIYDLERTT